MAFYLQESIDKLDRLTLPEAQKVVWQWIKEEYITFGEFKQLFAYLAERKTNKEYFQ